MSFRAYDWPKEYLYYSIIQKAIETSTIPYHIYPSPQYTNRFLANPETVISPQIIFLPQLNIGQFVMLNTILLYSIGFLGCWLIYRRYNLRPAEFVFLFLLFNFNGTITAHLAVGHSMWNGYFILPYFFIVIQDLLEKPFRTSLGIKFAFLTLVMLLQGSLHLVIGVWIFLLLIVIFNRKLVKSFMIIFAFTLPLISLRIIPAIYNYLMIPKEFISGYPSFLDLIQSLIIIRDHTFERIGSMFGKLGWWEFDAFIGLTGLAFILLFGVLLRFKKNGILDNDLFARLDIPLIIITFFSINYFYFPIAKIPLFSTERVVSRFFIIPLVWLIFISTVYSDNWIGNVINTWKRKLFFYLLISELGFILFTHSYTWRLDRLETAFANSFLNPNFGIAQIPDPSYFWVVNISWGISAISTIIYVIIIISPKLKWFYRKYFRLPN